MNFKQLQHFVTLAEAGNVHRGSARLNISQPALSKSIRALEEDLGAVLFERLSRGVRLTPVGQWLLSRSSALLAEIQEVQTELELIQRRENSSVRIAAGTVLCSSLMPLCLARLHQVAAHIQVSVESGYWDQQKQMLLNGEIDFLVADARELEDIVEFGIAQLPPEPIFAYVRAGHPLARRKKLALADLQQHAFSGLTRIPQELEKILRQYPELPASRPAAATLASNDFGLLRASAALTDLLFFSPPSAVQDQLARRELVQLKLALPPQLQTHFAIVWLKSRKLSTPAELMKHTILECAARQFAAAAGPKT
jgi:DNA-binding transcriptional LysR family regulator